jgi:hypothetical protein
MVEILLGKSKAWEKTPPLREQGVIRLISGKTDCKNRRDGPLPANEAAEVASAH